MMESDVYLVKGLRTPFSRVGGALSSVPLPLLASTLANALLDELPLELQQVDEVILGNIQQPYHLANIARQATLQMYPPCDAGRIPAMTVQRNCGSGLEAIAQAYHKIRLGRADAVVAGGVELMGQFAIQTGPQLQQLKQSWRQKRNWREFWQILRLVGLRNLVPQNALQSVLIDPVLDQSMGAHAEFLAHTFRISRSEQDQYALASHQKATMARQQRVREPLVLPTMAGPLVDQVIWRDDCVREHLTIEQLAKLNSAFIDGGSVTAGNSCPLTDGGVLMLLVSGRYLAQMPIDPDAVVRLVDVDFVAEDPKWTGIMAGLAIQKVVQRNSDWSLDCVEEYEINEAFSAQMLATLKYLESPQTYLGESQLPSGKIPLERINRWGGSLAIGHPLGASGARIVLELAQRMVVNKSARGCAALCIGGGQGGAILLERGMGGAA